MNLKVGNSLLRPYSIPQISKMRNLKYVYTTKPSKDTFIPEVVKFKTKDEIVKYFNKININVELEDFSNPYPKTFSNIAEQIKLLNKTGIDDLEVDNIVLSNWEDKNKTESILKKYNLNVVLPADEGAYCGANSRTVFINSSEKVNTSTNGVFQKFLHEVGHIKNYNYKDENGIMLTNGANSVLGENVADNNDFCKRQLDVLGVSAMADNLKIDIPYSVTNAIKMQNLDLKILMLENRPYVVDISRMIKYMNEACHCEQKTLVSDQVAEIFEDLIKGQRFDDLTMLMYDFNGGAKIPAMKINGVAYSDYIRSLYSQKELISKMKKHISIYPFNYTYME